MQVRAEAADGAAVMMDAAGRGQAAWEPRTPAETLFSARLGMAGGEGSAQAPGGDTAQVGACGHAWRARTPVSYTLPLQRLLQGWCPTWDSQLGRSKVPEPDAIASATAGPHHWGPQTQAPAFCRRAGGAAPCAQHPGRRRPRRAADEGARVAGRHGPVRPHRPGFRRAAHPAGGQAPEDRRAAALMKGPCGGRCS